MDAQGRLRGLRSVATQTKTTRAGGPDARAWIASSKAISEEGEGWMASWLSCLPVNPQGRDYLGVSARGDAKEADDDITILRQAAEAYAGPEAGEVRRVAASLRIHSAKATMNSWCQHQGNKALALRIQGGWKRKGGEVMTDVYLRESMTLALHMTERVLEKVREGWELPKFVKVADGPGVRLEGADLVAPLEEGEDLGVMPVALGPLGGPHPEDSSESSSSSSSSSDSEAGEQDEDSDSEDEQERAAAWKAASEEAATYAFDLGYVTNESKGRAHVLQDDPGPEGNLQRLCSEIPESHWGTRCGEYPAEWTHDKHRLAPDERSILGYDLCGSCFKGISEATQTFFKDG